MMMIDRKTFDALAALTAHPKAFFSLQQLLDHLAAHPDENPLVYANAVKLQLDVQAALETYLEGRKQLGLRNVMESVMLDIMYQLPSMPGVKECVINDAVIEKKAPPLYIYDTEAHIAS